MSVYLDWAATAPPDPEILAGAASVAIDSYGNPSSVHGPGKAAAKILAEARERSAKALGVNPETLFFTSGGTEADHIPLLALLQRPNRGTVAVSEIEHPAILEQAKMLECAGWKTIRIPADRDGFVTPDAVAAAIREDTAFVAVMAVNNETGAVQPIREIARRIIEVSSGKKKPHFHVDAVQSVGKVDAGLNLEGIDSAAISGHKIGAPRGIGILYLAHRVEPFIRGGGQEGGMRPGTENLAGAWAISMCLEKSKSARESADARNVMAKCIETVTSIPGVLVIPQTRSPMDERFSPYVVQFTNKRLPGEVLVRALSDRGVFISTGSACSSKKKTRHVLEAMKVRPEDQTNAFRISIGNATTIADIKTLAGAISASLMQF